MIEADIADARVLIALDLGSESSTCRVLDRRYPEAQSRQLDLQFFARVFATTPLVLSQDGKLSYAIRSRYFYKSDVILKPQKHPIPSEVTFNFKRSIDICESVRSIIPDSEKFIEGLHERASELWQPSSNLLSPIVFFSDQSSPNPMSHVLLNSKLAFMASLSTGVKYQDLTISAPELIQMQIGLILENFVRKHPFWRRNGYPDFEWEEAAIILTVPNTYSPGHVKTLEAMVSDLFDSPVKAISESDAVSFYAKDAVMHVLQEGKEADRLDTEIEVLTIDIGKGTTDASLMRYYLDQPRGSDNAALHQETLSRAGIVAGGGFLTYQMVKFLETVVLIFAKMSDAKLAAAHPFTKEHHKAWKDSPFTSFIDALNGFVDDVKKCWVSEDTSRTFLKNWPTDKPRAMMLALATKHFLMMCSDQASDVPKFDQVIVEAPDFELSPDWLEFVGAPLGRDLYYLFYFLPELLELARMPSDIAQTQGSGNIWSKFRAAHPQEWKLVVEARRELNHEVNKYVDANIDHIICDIAAEALHVPAITSATTASEALKKLFRDPQDAERARKRTYFVLALAGQASLFQPIQRRLGEIAARAGLGIREVEDVNDPNVSTPVHSHRIFGRIEQSADLNKHAIFLPLSASASKGACAEGALKWATSLPHNVNPDALFGGIRVTQVYQTGSKPWFIEMRELAEEPCTITTKVESNWSFYYIPSKLYAQDKNGAMIRDESPFLGRFAETTANLTSSVTLSMGGDSDPVRGVPMVSYVNNRSGKSYAQPIGGQMLGMSANGNNFLPLLWPARLQKEEYE